MKKITKNVLAVGVFVVLLFLIHFISKSYESYILDQHSTNETFITYLLGAIYQRNKNECAGNLGCDVFVTSPEHSEWRTKIDQIINHLISSNSPAIPEGTNYVANELHGYLSKRYLIVLYFNEEFISNGKDFVYNKSIPTITTAINRVIPELKDARYIYFIEGEELEKALEKKYKN